MSLAIIGFYHGNRSEHFKRIAEVSQIFDGANFSPDGIFSLFSGDEKKYFENFKNIRQAYDDVFVIKCSRNKFDEETAESLYGAETGGTCVFADEDKAAEAAGEFIKTLNEKYGVKYGKSVFKVFGVAEEKLSEVAETLSKNGVKILISGKNLDYKAEIVYDDKSTKMDFDEVQKKFVGALKDRIYATEDMSLAETLVHLLKLRGRKFSCAESFTGGSVAAEIVSVSGASEVFYEGIVAYNERAKEERLGVDEKSIETRKPVSAQVAGEMVEGLIAGGKAEVAVSTTGIAGPNSDDSGFPVGLCYIGLAVDGDIKVFKYVFDGDRRDVIEKGTKTALFSAIAALKNI